MITPAHIPVLTEEVIQALAVQPGGRYVDCTLGGGGHSLLILEHILPGGQLLGIDADPVAIQTARKRLSTYRDSVLLVNDNFSNLKSICFKYDFFPVHGILLDLGLSSLQLTEGSRGFSFQYEAPLDMRFSPDQEITAATIVNEYPEEELARIIRTYGEESAARRIASLIVNRRPVKTTTELAGLIEKGVGSKQRKIHPATKTFQALRIAVNRELEVLETTLKQAMDVLGFEGRLVVISYHSLEDRIVKQFFQHEAKDCICPPEIPVCTCGHKATLRQLNRRVITPSPEEIARNPRSRSARMRVVERIVSQEEHFDIIEKLCVQPETGSGRNVWRRPALLKELRKTYALV
ncbi:MAG: 16S rRNA (cytosine(1402)-N(4))-methyltransferase RsmH [Dehalococcoidales bacterium]|jgi:16S rRNA (cytosine1402-N4)-methyltransferase|nr:16S rRNA (cytosine(1402)-N(4))-methyltransferase RsmH [Dehalococcoidales bacterium]